MSHPDYVLKMIADAYRDIAIDTLPDTGPGQILHVTAPDMETDTAKALINGLQDALPDVRIFISFGDTLKFAPEEWVIAGSGECDCQYSLCDDHSRMNGFDPDEPWSEE